MNVSIFVLHKKRFFKVMFMFSNIVSDFLKLLVAELSEQIRKQHWTVTYSG